MSDDTRTPSTVYRDSAIDFIGLGEEALREWAEARRDGESEDEHRVRKAYTVGFIDGHEWGRDTKGDL